MLFITPKQHNVLQKITA